MYLGNKVVYLEQGVPTTGKLIILGIVGAVALFELTAGAAMLRGPFSFLLQGKGVLATLGALVLGTGAVSMVPVGEDPRANWGSDKGVPEALADAPNVLIIAVDTLRADYLGTYGREGDVSPVIDRFAQDAIVFEQGFASASWTRSSFASLWSSRSPSSHNTATKSSRMPDELVLLSEVLHDAGVTTANLANNINVTSTFYFDQGYDTFIYESPDYSFGASESVFSLTVLQGGAQAAREDRRQDRARQGGEYLLPTRRGRVEGRQGLHRGERRQPLDVGRAPDGAPRSLLRAPLPDGRRRCRVQRRGLRPGRARVPRDGAGPSTSRRSTSKRSSTWI